MLTDYHVHLRPDLLEATAQDHFTAENVQRYRERASAAGIVELGVAEHIHRFKQALAIWRHPFWEQNAIDDLEYYCHWVREETDLKLGLEVDFLPGREDQIANVLELGDWDFIIGSVHFLRDEAVDHDGYDIWRSHDAEEIWKRYFFTLGEAARSGLFDVLAHPDLVKVWGSERPQPTGDLRRFYELAMDGIAESQIVIELSTAGLRKPIGELYPSRELLEFCIEAGCPVALSSDAHRPEEVGHCYEQALQQLNDHGVKEPCVFERRERRLESIDQ